MEKLKILLIDDDVMVTELLATMMKKLGHQVTEINHPWRAINLVVEYPELYDLVFCDYDMPQLSGFSVIEKLNKINPNLLIVLMTGYFEDELKHKLESLFVFSILYKPFKNKDLSSLLNNFKPEVNIKPRVSQL